MGSKRYTVLGWAVWQVASRVAKRKMAQNRAKIGALGVIALVLLGGVVAARHARDGWLGDDPGRRARARAGVGVAVGAVSRGGRPVPPLGRPAGAGGGDPRA